MANRDFLDQLHGYSLTTAEILYRMPDHPSLLQTYLWQEYDLAPRFPRLERFLDFWSKNIEGGLCQIRIANTRLIHPREIAIVSGQFSIN
jgi:uncharacterized protein Usg